MNMKDINFLVNDTALGAREANEKQKTVVSIGKTILVILSLTAATLLLFVPGIIISGMESEISEIEQSMLDPKYRELRDTKAQLQIVTDTLNSKKAIINDIDAKSLEASQVILMVENAIPAGCYITSVNYSGSTLELKGKAESSLAYAELLGNLDSLKLLSRNSSNLDLMQTADSIEYSVQYSVAKNGGQ
jgi:Tfp pilus assembly protein PilN